jgi:4-amino-4-deoxy-L-arabinose transferase-like glycosyltransferase
VKKPHGEKYSKLAVILLLAVYIALSMASSFATRLRYGPDEPAHFIYVREIGSFFRMPGLAHEDTRDIALHASHEAHQPPLYYVIAALPYYLASKAGLDTDTIWTILRLFTILMGTGWVYFLYRLSRELLGPQRYAAVLSAACVGLLPMSTYIGGVVNNDALACMTFTAALWLIIRAVRRGKFTRRDVIAIGIASGLTILTKAQGIILVPTVLFAALMVARHNGWKGTKPVIIHAIASVIVAIIVSCVWFIRNWFVYDELIIQSLYNPLAQSVGGFGVVGWFAVTSLITNQLFKYFWLPYWLVPSLSQNYSTLYTIALCSLCVIVTVGVIGHLRRCYKNRAGDLSCRTDVWMLLILPGILIYVSLFMHTLLVDRGALAQGRLLLPAAGVFGIGLAKCIQTIRQSLAQKLLGLLVVIGLITANLMILNSIVLYYQSH